MTHFFLEHHPLSRPLTVPTPSNCPETVPKLSRPATLPNSPSLSHYSPSPLLSLPTTVPKLSLNCPETVPKLSLNCPDPLLSLTLPKLSLTVPPHYSP